MTTNDIKKTLSETTQQFEQHLEPWQRGLLIIVLTILLIISTYYLLKKEKPEPRELTDSERRKLETVAEERILKRVEFLKKLKE